MKKHLWLVAVAALALALVLPRACPHGPDPTYTPGPAPTVDTYNPVLPPTHHSNLPVPASDLPVSPSQVDTSIVIKPSPSQPSQPITVVIDRHGNVVTGPTTPSDTQVKVVVWKRPVFEIGYGWGLTMAYAKSGAYVCLSYDPVRVWRISLGADVGVGTQGGFLVGTSVKGAFVMTRSIDTAVVFGLNWLKSEPYVGLNIKWRF